MKNSAITILSLACLILSVAPANAQDQGQKAILVTGATTGIGRNLAETLAADGHFVYAGARKQSDMDDLNAIENVMAVRLDVTKQDDIDAAVELINREGRGLYGLVNNAGVAVVAPMIEVSEDDMQFQMDVNLFGPYRVTKAFAPLIIESKGRITTTGSISGILSSSFLGPYAMSKHAIEGYTDSLAAEMEKFGVAVSVVEPGNYNSAIGESLVKRMARNEQNSRDSLFTEEMATRTQGDGSRSQYKEPDEVSAAFMHFLFDAEPKRRYMVVPNEDEANRTISKAIMELAQLNEGQEYTYTRDELVAMLDEALN
jgi:NAD(P)-dependent dehydrogenase (short-subunit alcohol dehydrogenase family)